MSTVLFIAMIVLLALFVAAAAVDRRTECPSPLTPVNGVIKCLLNGTSLECTATCLEGFSFESGQRVVTKRCNETSGQWEGDVAKLTCIKPCLQRLLMGNDSNELQNFTASSSLPGVAFGPAAALFSREGAWRPSEDDITQFIQIDLGKAYHVTHIVIRGDEAGSYVSLFRLLHSDDNIRWHPYSEDNIVDKFFSGNVDSQTDRTILLTQPLTARYIRLNPLSWENHIALKIDIRGCSSTEDVTPSPGDSANAVPLTHKLRTRVTRIWGDRRGQPARSAMDRPRPGKTPLVIRVPPVPEEGRCKVPFPPDKGAVSCEGNVSRQVCTAFCLGNLVFENKGPAIHYSCNEESDEISDRGFPPCIERNTTTVPFVNISGSCMFEEIDCLNVASSNYQYCGSCHHFSTCSSGYLYVRACPEQLEYDARKGQCEYRSSTCSTSHVSRRAQV